MDLWHSFQVVQPTDATIQKVPDVLRERKHLGTLQVNTVPLILAGKTNCRFGAGLKIEEREFGCQTSLLQSGFNPRLSRKDTPNISCIKHCPFCTSEEDLTLIALFNADATIIVCERTTPTIIKIKPKMGSRLHFCVS